MQKHSSTSASTDYPWLVSPGSKDGGSCTGHVHHVCLDRRRRPPPATVDDSATPALSRPTHSSEVANGTSATFGCPLSHPFHPSKPQRPAGKRNGPRLKTKGGRQRDCNSYNHFGHEEEGDHCRPTQLERKMERPEDHCTHARRSLASSEHSSFSPMLPSHRPRLPMCIRSSDAAINARRKKLSGELLFWVNGPGRV